ncbi:MAG: HhH-GPD family protein [Vulcanimicrobiaceae bacterium]
MKGVSRKLLLWYRRHGRADLPWRAVRDPYVTLVSEFMLQQTQVERVIPKFAAFIRCFPDVARLAQAGRAEVIRAWQGLGYNIRSVRLHLLAGEVVRRFGGVVPADSAVLRTLPGVGPYTCSAIRAFAFDCDDVAMDTNVRRVVHRLCYGMEYPPRATPQELDARAAALLPRGKGHDWNSAMMDLGAAICTARAPKCLVCPLREDCVSAPIEAARLDAARKRSAGGPSSQSVRFEATVRYARGRVVDRLRELAADQRISFLDLYQELRPVLAHRSLEDVRSIVAALESDGLLRQDGEFIALAQQ